MRRRRRMIPVGSLGESLLRRIDPEGRRHRADVVTAWPRAAGPEVAAHTCGFSLRAGEFVVFVDSPAWAAELSLMSEGYRERLNEEAGRNLVKSIRFVVSKRGRQDPIQTSGNTRGAGPQKAPRVPLGEVERRQVLHAAAAVGDEDLRDAVVRAMTRDLECRKATPRECKKDPSRSPKDPS